MTPIFTRKKKCFAAGCKERVPLRLLMCKRHWAMVPHELRVEVYGALDIWQCGGSPRAYLDVIKRAAAAVARTEVQLISKHYLEGSL